MLPEPFTILKRHLKPFSFGHLLILKRFGIGYACEDVTKLTIEDLIFSVFICSHAYRECKELLYNGKWYDEVKSWASECKGTDIDMVETAKEFRRYLDHHTIYPLFRNTTKNNSTSKANGEWYEKIIKDLTTKLSYSHDDALELCYSRAMYEYLSYWEQQDSIAFYSDTELEKMFKYQEECRQLAREKDA